MKHFRLNALTSVWHAVLAAALGVGCSSSNGAPPPAPDAGPTDAQAPAAQGLAKLNHVVVIVLENWSFDSLYGEFKGADGLPAQVSNPQVDASGAVYSMLPETDPKVPASIPNGPFALDPYISVGDRTTVDLTTKFYQEQAQIHGGKMDRFVSVSSAKGLTMGYFHTADLPLAKEAADYTLCDHFHHAAFGGSFLNHMWLIAAASPKFPDAPQNMVAVLDPNGNPTPDPQSGALRDGPVTPDGYAVNTVYSVNTPHPAGAAPATLLPNQTMPNIGDRLSEKGIDWAWYAGGWDDAVAGRSDPAQEFQYHHHPFTYFANYADGTPAKAAHLKDETAFMTAAKAGTLPAVSYVKPVGIDNEHPMYADVIGGEEHVLSLIEAVRNGPQWKDSAVVVIYDENGGFWDHVAPPGGDRWGPGTRIPALVISPFARRGFVDHTVYDTTSVLALIEHRWGLAPLGTRDAAAADLTAAFDFGP